VRSTSARGIVRRALLVTAFVLAGGAAFADHDASGAGNESTFAAIEPFDVARAIRDGSRLRLVAARDSAERAAIALPATERADAGILTSLELNPGDTIVIVATADEPVHAAMNALRARGAVVLAMRGGADGWIDQVLAPLPPAADAGAAERARHREALELSRWFGGLPSSVELDSRSARGDAGRRSPARRIFRGC
jgi:hypothetical protein